MRRRNILQSIGSGMTTIGIVGSSKAMERDNTPNIAEPNIKLRQTSQYSEQESRNLALEARTEPDVQNVFPEEMDNAKIVTQKDADIVEDHGAVFAVASNNILPDENEMIKVAWGSKEYLVVFTQFKRPRDHIKTKSRRYRIDGGDTLEEINLVLEKISVNGELPKNKSELSYAASCNTCTFLGDQQEVTEEICVERDYACLALACGACAGYCFPDPTIAICIPCVVAACGLGSETCCEETDVQSTCVTCDA